MLYDCVGLGIVVYDELAVIDHFPKPNSKNRLRSLSGQGGGPVATAMATCARLGKTCAMISALGQDATGQYLNNELASFNVDTTHMLRKKKVATPRAFILVDQSTGERTVFLHQDPECRVDNLDPNAFPFKNCRILHLDGHYPEADLQAAKIAKQNGAYVSLDIGSNRRVWPELLELTDIAIVSKSYSDQHLVADEPLKSAEKLFNTGIKIAGVTCGIEGSYFFDDQGECYQPAFKVNTIDSTGAGDVFHGAALFGILEGFPMQKTALFASAAAALKCGHLGGKAGIPILQQITDFIAKRVDRSDFIQ